MLNIFFGDMPEAIYNTSVYFKNTYKEKWLLSELTKEMIQDVDNSVVINEKIIESPIFGNITPVQLSCGVKALILIANDRTKVFNASNCGDNCAKWILKIADIANAKNRKVLINLHHLMDFGNGDFKIKVVNTNKTVKNMAELVTEAGRFV